MSDATLPTYPFDTPPGSDWEPAGARLLEKGPTARARMPSGHDVRLVLSYELVRQVLADPRFSREAATRPGGAVTNQAAANPEFLVSMDPPRHNRIRGLMAKAFSPRMVESLAPRVRAITDGLLDQVVAHGRPADLVSLFAEPLPIMVICELLGVPDADRAAIRRWARILMSETAYTPTEIMDTVGEVNAYLEKLVVLRREHPDEALISALTAVNDEGGHLSPSELVSNVQLLLIAGHETTVSQIGNCVVTLMRHPQQTALLRARPELLQPAVDELLRHSKLLTTALPRVATADVQLGDTRIQAGEAVLPLIAVANRDPTVFPEPHRFDITRTGPAPHVGLGHGPHFCLGAQLARLELRTALDALLTRFPALAPAVSLDDLDWKAGMSTRSLNTLPITW
jgi:cytochrome P450